MKQKYFVFKIIFSILIFAGVLFSNKLLGGNSNYHPNENKINELHAATSIVQAHFAGNFTTSLNVKEGTDTLIVPAKLVQQLLNEKIVKTYPVE